MRIAANVCKTELKSRPSRIPEQAAEAGIPAQDPDDTVYRAVTALPDSYRLPVVLFYYQGFSVREIAGMLRLPGATVRTRLARARSRLKDELKGWYTDDER